MKSAPLQHKPSTWRLMLAPCIQMWSQGVLNKYLLEVRFTAMKTQACRCIKVKGHVVCETPATLIRHWESTEIQNRLIKKSPAHLRFMSACSLPLSLFISQPSSVNQRGGLGVCGEIMFKQRITLKLTPDASLCVRVWVQAHVTLLSI